MCSLACCWKGTIMEPSEQTMVHLMVHTRKFCHNIKRYDIFSDMKWAPLSSTGSVGPENNSWVAPPAKHSTGQQIWWERFFSVIHSQLHRHRGNVENKAMQYPQSDYAKECMDVYRPNLVKLPDQITNLPLPSVHFTHLWILRPSHYVAVVMKLWYCFPHLCTSCLTIHLFLS